MLSPTHTDTHKTMQLIVQIRSCEVKRHQAKEILKSRGTTSKAKYSTHMVRRETQALSMEN